MSKMLSELLVSLLLRWAGPLPQLAYVADSGGNESTYFETTLKRMRHPRTGKQLKWQRVVDYTMPRNAYGPWPSVYSEAEHKRDMRGHTECLRT